MPNHLEVWELENAWMSPADKAWSRFVDDCERLLGIDSLDGNEADGTDAYSLDSAYDAWNAGKTPQEYVAGRTR